jgi:rhodanese-related sulfurtransferase
MKLFIKTLVALLILVSVSSCGTSQTTDEKQGNQNQEQVQKGTIVNVDVAAFEKMIQDNEGILVDVRTPGEYADGHIANAQLVDYKSADFKEKIAKLDKDQPVLVYCRSGHRSGESAKIMVNELGFKKVINLDGGFLAWSGEGKEVEK